MQATGHKWGSLNFEKLVIFFKRAKKAVQRKGFNHQHDVFIEPQAVSTLGVYRIVHEKPLTVAQVNALKKAASEAGIRGLFKQVHTTEGRTGSLEFRFSGEDPASILSAFQKAHGRKMEITRENERLVGLSARYRFL